MFNAKTPYVAITLLVLGYLAAVFVLMAGVTWVSLLYLAILASLGVLTSKLVRKKLVNADLSAVNSERSLNRRTSWNVVELVFMALIVFNLAILVSSFVNPIERYTVPIPEVFTIIVFMIIFMNNGIEENKRVQRAR